MGQIKPLLGTLILLLVSVQAGAAIINASNTNTEYDKGVFADLQGLEWLTLDETKGQSRISIESGYGGFFADGWRYATLEETGNLILSLWGGVYRGYSPGNAAGAKWFGDNFGFTSHHFPEISDLNEYDLSMFLYGSDGECNVDINRSCLYVIRWAEELKFTIKSHYEARNVIKISYIPGDGDAGAFHDPLHFLSVDLQRHPDEPKSTTGNELASLLVRDSTVSNLSPIPAPAYIWSSGVALIGLIGYRKRRKPS
jgi:hypothetical protein